MANAKDEMFHCAGG